MATNFSDLQFVGYETKMNPYNIVSLMACKVKEASTTGINVSMEM